MLSRFKMSIRVLNSYFDSESIPLSYLIRSLPVISAG